MRYLLACLLLASASVAQTTRPTTRPAGAPGASGLEVVIKSARIDYLALRKKLPDGGFEDLASSDKLVIITLTITNKGEKQIAYATFNGKGQKDDHGSLLDSDRKFSALANFGPDIEPAGRTNQATLNPGDSITDVIAFAPPAGTARPVTLFLPARNHGDGGLWKLDVKIEE